MSNENEIDNFDILLADKRHKELVGSIGKLVTEIQKQKPDDGVKQAIEKQSKLIEEFIEAIRQMPKPETTNVNVETNQQEVVSSLETMCEKILNGLSEMNQPIDIRPNEWEFKVRRNHGGYIETITAKGR